MRLLVIGATGRLGSEVVRQALAAGHHVTAFARNPAAVRERGERLDVVQGDVLDQRSIERALDGHDAVVSCLGTRDRRQRDLREAGTRQLVAAMEARGVGRLVAFSAFGVGDSRAQLTRTTFFFSRVILPLLLARQFEDMAAMEALVRDSGLEWVIVRPSALTTKPATGDVKVFLDGHGKVGSSIPIADVAAFMLECAASPAYLGAAPVISSSP
jgi:uncharacterized protein YbjT (DUF2867 family)